MSMASRIAWDDTILPFQLDRTSIRGRVARLDRTIDQIITRHDYPAPVQALVAEAALLTALIGQTIKLRWRLSLQIRGEGPIRLIATDFFAPSEPGKPAQLRAYASFDREAMDDDVPPFEMLDKGLFGIIIDQGPDMQPYQGITPLSGGSLAACASTYFAQSEQLPTKFVLGCALAEQAGQAPSWRAGGIMVQHLARPGEAASTDAEVPDDGLMSADAVLDGDASENWNRTITLLETTELTEMVGPYVGSDDLLRRLFHEEQPRVYDPQPIEFGCTCSPERLNATLETFSASELEDLVQDDGRVAAECQFCGASYSFDPNI